MTIIDNIKTINNNSLIKPGNLIINEYKRQSPNHYYSEGDAFNFKYKDGTNIITFTRNQDWFANCKVGNLEANVFNFNGNETSGAFTATPQNTNFNITNGGNRYNITLVPMGFKPNDLNSTLYSIVYITYVQKNSSLNVMTPDIDFYFEKA